MSLDVYLKLPGAQPIARSGIFIRDGGSTREITRAEWDERYPGQEPVTVSADDGYVPTVFDANVTHNLATMAGEASIYEVL